MTLAKRIDQWALEHEERGEQKGMQQGISQGITKGITQGERLLLQRQLTRRFGALPISATRQIAEASSTQIELWGDRVLDAASLDEVFKP